MAGTEPPGWVPAISSSILSSSFTLPPELPSLTLCLKHQEEVNLMPVMAMSWLEAATLPLSSLIMTLPSLPSTQGLDARAASQHLCAGSGVPVL